VFRLACEFGWFGSDRSGSPGPLGLRGSLRASARCALRLAARFGSLRSPRAQSAALRAAQRSSSDVRLAPLGSPSPAVPDG
jgi:hypothetical protein